MYKYFRCSTNYGLELFKKTKYYVLTEKRYRFQNILLLLICSNGASVHDFTYSLKGFVLYVVTVYCFKKLKTRELPILLLSI